MSSLPDTPPAGRVEARSRVLIGDDGFVADAVLDAWTRAGEVVRTGALLRVRDGGHFLLQDALRILGPRNGEVDMYGATGRVDAIRSLLREGARLSSGGVRIGAAMYDVEYGVLALFFNPLEPVQVEAGRVCPGESERCRRAGIRSAAGGWR